MDITPIINAVIALIAAIVAVFVIPWLKKNKWVSIAVAAAEQLFKGLGRGTEKKQYVLEVLESKGFKIDLDLENMIEAAVYKLTNGATE